MDDNELFGGMSELSAAATQLHELYASLVHAGFREDQALQLVISVMLAGGAR